MLRYLLSLCLLIGLFSGGAYAQTPPPIPAQVAVPAHDVAHPGSITEWWYVHVADPATKQVFIATFNTAPFAATGMFWYDVNGVKTYSLVPTEPYVTTSTPSVSNSAGSLTWNATRKAYHLVYNANGMEADLWLDNGKPGITAGPLNYDGQNMYWTVPVMTSYATGWVKPAGGNTISVNGWRGYHDHNWGAFSLINQATRGWEWAVSHEVGGGASLLGGVVSGNGTWQGFVAKVTPLGTAFCPSTIALSDVTTINGFQYPATVTAGCAALPPLSQTWHVEQPYVVNNAPFFSFTESVGRTTPGSIALIEHLRTATWYGQ